MCQTSYMRVHACNRVYTCDFCACETRITHVSLAFSIEFVAGLYRYVVATYTPLTLRFV